MKTITYQNWKYCLYVDDTEINLSFKNKNDAEEEVLYLLKCGAPRKEIHTCLVFEERLIDTINRLSVQEFEAFENVIDAGQPTLTFANGITSKQWIALCQCV